MIGDDIIVADGLLLPLPPPPVTQEQDPHGKRDDDDGSGDEEGCGGNGNMGCLAVLGLELIRSVRRVGPVKHHVNSLWKTNPAEQNTAAVKELVPLKPSEPKRCWFNDGLWSKTPNFSQLTRLNWLKLTLVDVTE